MTNQDITDQLNRIASGKPDDFSFYSYELTDAWSAAGVGIESLDPILRFMEDHPDIDYGSPGSLIHFMEMFNGKEYENKLIESIERIPTLHTIWMLRRLINGTQEAHPRLRLIETMKRIRVHPLFDQGLSSILDLSLKNL